MPFCRPPACGTAAGVNYHWHSQPARGHSIGGDGLFLERDRSDGQTLWLLADAMGHGARAAPTLDVLEHLLTDPHNANRQPADLLRRLHGMMQPVWAQTYSWVAGAALLVQPHGGRVTAAMAGVPPPRFGRPGGPWTVWEGIPGSPLGIPVEGDYRQASVPLPEGSFLLAVTDGVTEAGAPGPQFGEPGLQAFLGGLPAGLVQAQLVDNLFITLQTYTGDAWATDDTTALCLARG